MERLEDDPVADDVLDVVGGGAQEHQSEVAAVVPMVERPELRGPRGGERRSTHRDGYNLGGCRRCRPSRGWGPAGRGAVLKRGTDEGPDPADRDRLCDGSLADQV